LIDVETVPFTLRLVRDATRREFGGAGFSTAAGEQVADFVGHLLGASSIFPFSVFGRRLGMLFVFLWFVFSTSEDEGRNNSANATNPNDASGNLMAL
jgi:hypothetical protein